MPSSARPSTTRSRSPCSTSCSSGPARRTSCAVARSFAPCT